MLKKALLIALLVALPSCQKNVEPITSSSGEFGSTENEKFLFSESERMYRELDDKGLVLKNSIITDYVTELGNSLVTDENKNLVDYNFYVLRNPTINAFATANGSIYMNLGLIAKVENDVQLAQVLAHEIAHVDHRHVFEAYETRKANMQAAHITDIVLMGTGLSYLPYSAATLGHSRENEMEADNVALHVLGKKGYDVNKTARLFEIMNETKKAEIAEGSIWSSHPSNVERVKNLKKLAAESNYEVTKASKSARFNEIKKEAVIQNIELKLINKHYSLAANSVEEEIKKAPDNEKLHYLKGESYRMMTKDPEGLAREYAWINDESFSEEKQTEYENQSDEFFETAKKSYGKAIKLNSDYAKSYKGLGLLLHSKGSNSEAKVILQKYLDSSQKIYDRRYIQNLIKGMENET